MRNNTLAFLAAAVVLTVFSGTTYTIYASDLLKDISAGAGRENVLAEAYGSDLSPLAGAEKILEDDISASDDFSVSSDTVLSNSAEKSTEENNEDPFEGLCLADVENSMNVREEPSENSALAGYLYKDCVGTVLEQKNGWTHLISGELEGWAKSSYLLFGDEAEQRIKETSEEVATVTAETLRVRKEAAADAEVSSLLAKGQEVNVLEEGENWTAIEYDDGTEGTDSGYVSSAYIKVGYDFNEGETYDEVQARLAKEEEAKKKAAAAKVSASRTKATTITNTGAAAASTDDVTLLAALIQCECGYEPYEGQLAVGAVVVNRAKGRYGSISAAVYAPGQFGPASSGKLAVTLAAGAIGATARQAAQQAISGVSNVGTATHFRNIRSGYSGIVIGNHVFW